MTSSAKSPFKKLFESQKQEDGRILITYKKKNMWFGPISAFFPAVIGSSVISTIILEFRNSINTYYPSHKFDEIDFGILVLTFLGLYYWLAKTFFYLKRKIEIKPGDSITSNNIRFPINELNSIDVRDFDLSHYVISVSGRGQEFIFTGPILGNNVAIAIKNEIQKNLYKTR